MAEIIGDGRMGHYIRSNGSTRLSFLFPAEIVNKIGTKTGLRIAHTDEFQWTITPDAEDQTLPKLRKTKGKWYDVRLTLKDDSVPLFGATRAEYRIGDDNTVFVRLVADELRPVTPRLPGFVDEPLGEGITHEAVASTKAPDVMTLRRMTSPENMRRLLRELQTIEDWSPYKLRRNRETTKLFWDAARYE